MSRFRFELLDKTWKDNWLPQLFDILYNNMRDIVPSHMPYHEEKEQWLAEVGPAMDKAPRQIVLIYKGENITGYFQYYVYGGVFMVEEIQIVKEYQHTTLFFALIRYLKRILPAEIETIAAYAHKLNLGSQAIMKKLGMEQMETIEGEYCFYKGDFAPVACKFGIR